MLGSSNATATATIAVKDLDAAREFYETTLDLKPIREEGSEAVTYQTGDSTVLVYRSEFAGTNQATAVTWLLDEGLDEVVQELRSKGIQFEHYDMPGMTREGDVHIAGDTRIAWFKDRDGNIHALVAA